MCHTQNSGLLDFLISSAFKYLLCVADFWWILPPLFPARPTLQLLGQTVSSFCNPLPLLLPCSVNSRQALWHLAVKEEIINCSWEIFPRDICNPKISALCQGEKWTDCLQEEVSRSNPKKKKYKQRVHGKGLGENRIIKLFKILSAQESKVLWFKRTFRGHLTQWNLNYFRQVVVYIWF